MNKSEIGIELEKLGVIVDLNSNTKNELEVMLDEVIKEKEDKGFPEEPEVKKEEEVPDKEDEVEEEPEVKIETEVVQGFSIGKHRNLKKVIVTAEELKKLQNDKLLIGYDPKKKEAIIKNKGGV